jgi:uncharacterized protein
MIIHELTPSECRDCLARTTLGRLACAQANQPYITPIFFAFDGGDDCLYSFSTVGQKIDWMRQNPRVCLEIDEITDELNWATVVVFGRYEELTASGQTPALDRARALFERRPSWWLPAAGKLASGEEHGSPVVYRVRIEAATGRRTGPTVNV